MSSLHLFYIVSSEFRGNVQGNYKTPKAEVGTDLLTQTKALKRFPWQMLKWAHIHYYEKLFLGPSPSFYTTHVGEGRSS